MKALSISTLSALVLAAPLTAAAQGTYQAAGPGFDDRWYIAPFATYTWANDDRGMDDNWGGGLAVGKPLNKWFNLELRATYTELSSDWGGNDNFSIDGKNKVFDVGVDGLFFFSRGHFQPYLLLGIGGIHDDVEVCGTWNFTSYYGGDAGQYCASNAKWAFMAEAGAGFMVPINDRISFRADARYRYDGNSNSNEFIDSRSGGDWVATAGIVIALGSRAAPPVTRTYELSADALFGFNKYDLTPTGVGTINTFARDLEKANYSGVRVAGHTDPIGSEEFNLALSDRRANTVRQQLVTDGVPADRISAQGYGKTQLKVTPADCAHTKSRAALIECYQPNRRVEVTVEGMTAKE